MPRVLIADKLEPAGIDLLKQAGIEVDNRPGLKGDDLKAALRQADAVICRSQPKITADLLDEPGKLRAIARAGVGVDTIDVPAATRRGIVVMNTPGGNTVSAAEHTVALMMALARQVPAADAAMKAGGWDRNKFLGTQLAGTWRASAIMRATVCSAAETVLPPGVFMTTIPLRVAAGTSMVSTPTPPARGSSS